MLIFYLTWAAWLISEVALNRLWKADSTLSRQRDRGTMAVIWVMIALGITTGVLVSLLLNMPVLHGPEVALAGVVLIVAGMALRFAAVYSLGRYFTVDLAIHEGHEIKQDGLYRLVRHPSYTGSLVSFLGFGLTLNNWISLAVVMGLVIPAFIRRIRIEEKLLQDELGDAYRDYMKKTWRLVPWIY